MSAVNSDRHGNVKAGNGASGSYVKIGAVRYYGFSTAITANSTTCEGADGELAPAGSRATTTHETGRDKSFYSDGAKWQVEIDGIDT